MGGNKLKRIRLSTKNPERRGYLNFIRGVYDVINNFNNITSVFYFDSYSKNGEIKIGHPNLRIYIWLKNGDYVYVVYASKSRDKIEELKEKLLKGDSILILN